MMFSIYDDGDTYIVSEEDLYFHAIVQWIVVHDIDACTPFGDVG